MMTLAEAQAWCEHPDSSGCLRGTHWAYFYTSVANYIACHAVSYTHLTLPTICSV